MEEVNDPAGFWIRLGAILLDGLIIMLPLSLLFKESALNVIEALYSLLVPLFWSGYTVGKRIVGIRIARIDGEKLTIWTMLMRNIVSGIVYAITLGIAVIVSAFMVGLREDKRAIHDFIAGTYVTYNQPEE